MCGIAGIMTSDGANPPSTLLDRLSQALAHRGPDGRGQRVLGGVGLVHTRLAVIDLEGGRQPLTNGGHLALVANGEIYNFRELRESIRARDREAVFLTASDCEPPLHLYARHGADYVEHLRGMYAIALHDAGRRRLFLSRDPFGIKPLYYVERADGLAFASEAQALIAAGLARAAIEPAKVEELLQLQFTTGAETVFPDIRRVLPGETLIIEQGRIVERRRRAALPEGGPISTTREAALYELDKVLSESVALHQRSDVPYGMFLSGGVDSSALLALMDRLNVNPVIAFTAGFPGAGVPDEREAARGIARLLGADHHEVDFDEDDFWTLLPQAAAAMDDPAADYAILPTYKLAREAARLVKVVLSGEGGDELFAGYGRYRKASRMLLPRAMRLHGAFDGLDVLRNPPSGWRAGLEQAERAADRPGRTALQRAQAVDVCDWLPNDLLTKLDRCLMAHGLEGRVPFIDPGVAAFAFRLPDRLKVRRRQGKWLLKTWLARTRPETLPFARKRGFTVPVAEWIAARGRTLGPLVARQPGIEELCRPKAVQDLFAALHNNRKAGFAAWTVLFYALWHRRHVLGQAPDGDVLACLSERP